jgi:hypothetical protein
MMAVCSSTRSMLCMHMHMSSLLLMMMMRMAGEAYRQQQTTGTVA